MKTILFSLFLGILNLQTYGEQTYTTEELKVLKQKGNSYDTEALKQIVDICAAPTPQITDQEAINFLQLAAALGNAKALAVLSVCYKEGKWVSKDTDKARELAQRVRKSKDTDAIAYLKSNTIATPTHPQQEIQQQTTSQELSEQEARHWADMLIQQYTENDLSYMHSIYESMIQELNTGKLISLEEQIKSEKAFIRLWSRRSCEGYDYAWKGNRIEIRFHYTRTSTKGKTISGYCKATWCISSRGRIEATAGETATDRWPEFSNLVGTPRSY